MSVKNLLVIAPLAALLSTTGCGPDTQTARPTPPPVAVTVQEVSYVVAPYYEEYPAIVRALQEVELRPQIGGYITGIHFSEGSKVKKGQVLYSIDPQQSQAAYQQAQANLAAQETNLDKAEKDLARYRELGQQDAIAKQQVDYAEASFAAARQQVEAAKAALNLVQTNVRYATIVAPFDGTIGISQVRLGTSVSPGQTLLNTLSSDDPMGVDVVVPQADIAGFTQLLAQGQAGVPDSTFRLTLNKDRYPHYGTLSLIDRAVDPQTGTIRVRAVFPNPLQNLRPGMTASLGVLSNTATKSVTIPFKAVAEQLGEFFVYVSDGSKVSQRRVKVGKQLGTSVVINDGLKEGEVIVVEGVQNLREGSAITVAAPAVAK